MTITENFNKNIIIYAVGEYQIKLLFMIYFNLNKYHNCNFKYSSILMNEEYKKSINSNIQNQVDFCNSRNEKLSCLYIPNINKHVTNISMSSGTVFIKNKLEKYYKTKNLVYDGFLNSITKYIDLKDYKLVYMKEFLDMYGKYLFIDKAHRDEFVENNSYLEKSPIFQTIKSFNYD